MKNRKTQIIKKKISSH